MANLHLTAWSYFNEIEPYAADWLRNLMLAGQIAPDIIDTRSIEDVQPDDLRGFRQHHFFAGIGGWSLAARLAGWPDERPLWTASCPCQPFSQAGKGLGTDDPRHLWPHLLRLWRAFRPAVGVGEQVAGKAGYGWFDGVRADLAGEGYACRAVDIPACAVDAPHQRQRLYWAAVADASRRGCDGRQEGEERRALERAPAERADDARRAPSGVTLGDACCPRSQGQPDAGWQSERAAGRADAQRTDGRDGGYGSLDHADISGFHFGMPREPFDAPEAHGGETGKQRIRADHRQSDDAYNLGDAPGDRWQQGLVGSALARHGHFAAPAHGRNGSWWAGADWIACHDGKARRVADAAAPLLAHGTRGRVAVPRPAELCAATFPEEERWVSRISAWKGIGNAIVPPLAAEVIGALADVLDAE